MVWPEEVSYDAIMTNAKRGNHLSARGEASRRSSCCRFDCIIIVAGHKHADPDCKYLSDALSEPKRARKKGRWINDYAFPSSA
jgi:hypothetical protein